MSAAIQIVRFHIASGVTEAEFEAINERFQREVAPKLPGLERREASRTDAGEWVLVLRYRDMETATAPPSDHGMEVAGKMMSMIDMASMSASFSTVMSD